MGGFSIGIGVGLRYPTPNLMKGKISPPTYLSCFGTGIWEMEGVWLSEDKWKMEGTNPPFLPTGIWNDEGIYRFKDEFNFGASFLPTGFVLFDLTYRYDDKIKIKYNIKDAVLQENNEAIMLESNIGYIKRDGGDLVKNKSYWNF